MSPYNQTKICFNHQLSAQLNLTELKKDLMEGAGQDLVAGKYAKAQGLENTFAMLLFFFLFLKLVVWQSSELQSLVLHNSFSSIKKNI